MFLQFFRTEQISGKVITFGPKYRTKAGGFGYIQTTWHRLRGPDWVKMYRYGSSAAWGSAIPPTAPMYDTAFGTALRLVGQDMKVTDYLDTGHLNHQVPPSWWM